MRIVAVPKERAQDLLRRLHSSRLVDQSLKISKQDDEILIPLVAEPPFDLGLFGARWEDRPRLRERRGRRDVMDQIQQRLRTAGIPLELAPHRWKRIGDVLVLQIAEAAQDHARSIAAIYGSVLATRAVIEDRSGIHGRLRTPDIRILWGHGTETVHVEGGIRYALDVAQVMMSPGNIEERMGIAGRLRPGAIVTDLFAGIGYFALPIAIRGQAEIVYACEINPTSYAFLVRNIRLNRAANVIPLLGDCREVAPRGVADYVIMGHFDAREYLGVAFAALRGKGTIVYHGLSPKEQYPDRITQTLGEAARANWRNVTSIRTRIVKSYAPGIVHEVAELDVAPQARI